MELTRRLLLPLLAYGEAREAAALLATVAKVVSLTAPDWANIWGLLLRFGMASAVSLLGDAMIVAPSLSARGVWDAAAVRELVGACVALAAASPAEVRAAAAAACQERPVTARRNGRGGGGSRAITAAEGSPPPPWHPHCARALLPGLRAAGHEVTAAAAEALAAQLERWGRGGGGGSEAADGARLLAMLPESGAVRLLAAVPRTGAVQGLPPTCANPECCNLSGDSEAELRLQAFGGCGEVAYCCRECQTAHWRAGHSLVCMRLRPPVAFE